MKLTHMHGLTKEDLRAIRTIELPSSETCQHYVKNCAGIISGFAQVLTREDLPSSEKIKEYGKKIDENLRDILEFLEKYKVI